MNSIHSPTIAIIQARMSSTRLPGKVLVDIAGKPMLTHVVERAQRSKKVDMVVVATTTDPVDDPIARLCTNRGYLLHRGSLHDVLDRYYSAVQAFGAQVIVRLTADCPLIDPRVIDQTILAFQGNFPELQSNTGEQNSTKETDGKQISESAQDNSLPQIPSTGIIFDFACTRLPPPWHRTFPIGQDVEICSLSALERAWKESSEPYHREHVMPYLYEECRSIHFTITIGDKPCLLPRQLNDSPGNVMEPFHVLVINHEPDEGKHRWTVDTPQDLEFTRQIFDRFSDQEFFGWKDVLALVKREPDLELINTMTAAKDYRAFDQTIHKNR